MLYQFEIVCVKRAADGNICEIGVVDRDSGLHLNCCIDIHKAVQGERGGLWSFYTTSSENGVVVRTRVQIVRGKFGPYLRTASDQRPRNNLRALPECGDCEPCLDV